MEKMDNNLEPKHVSDENPKFSYFDLKYDSAFTSDGHKLISFYVDTENPFFIDMYRWEFEEYQRNFFDNYDKLFSENKCTCDITTPKFELITVNKIIITLKDEESGEDFEEEIQTPVYFVTELVKNFKISLHLDHNTVDLNNFNLN